MERPPIPMKRSEPSIWQKLFQGFAFLFGICVFFDIAPEIVGRWDGGQKVLLFPALIFGGIFTYWFIGWFPYFLAAFLRRLHGIDRIWHPNEEPNAMQKATAGIAILLLSPSVFILGADLLLKNEPDHVPANTELFLWLLILVPPISFYLHWWFGEWPHRNRERYNTNSIIDWIFSGFGIGKLFSRSPSQRPFAERGRNSSSGNILNRLFWPSVITVFVMGLAIFGIRENPNIDNAWIDTIRPFGYLVGFVAVLSLLNQLLEAAKIIMTRLSRFFNLPSLRGFFSHLGRPFSKSDRWPENRQRESPNPLAGLTIWQKLKPNFAQILHLIVGSLSMTGMIVNGFEHGVSVDWLIGLGAALVIFALSYIFLGHISFAVANFLRKLLRIDRQATWRGESAIQKKIIGATWLALPAVIIVAGVLDVDALMPVLLPIIGIGWLAQFMAGEWDYISAAWLGFRDGMRKQMETDPPMRERPQPEPQPRPRPEPQEKTKPFGEQKKKPFAERKEQRREAPPPRPEPPKEEYRKQASPPQPKPAPAPPPSPEPSNKHPDDFTDNPFDPRRFGYDEKKLKYYKIYCAKAEDLSIDTPESTQSFRQKAKYDRGQIEGVMPLKPLDTKPENDDKY